LNYFYISTFSIICFIPNQIIQPFVNSIIVLVRICTNPVIFLYAILVNSVFIAVFHFASPLTPCLTSSFDTFQLPLLIYFPFCLLFNVLTKNGSLSLPFFAVRLVCALGQKRANCRLPYVLFIFSFITLFINQLI